MHPQKHCKQVLKSYPVNFFSEGSNFVVFCFTGLKPAKVTKGRGSKSDKGIFLVIFLQYFDLLDNRGKNHSQHFVILSEIKLDPGPGNKILI